MQTLKLQCFASPTNLDSLPEKHRETKKGWKSLEFLLSWRYIQVCPLPPEQQNNLDCVLIVCSVLLNSHCNPVKRIKSCLIHCTKLPPFCVPSRLQEVPHTVTALELKTNGHNCSKQEKKSRRDPNIVENLFEVNG